MDYHKKYYQAHKEHLKEYNNKYYYENWETLRIKQKAYYQKNREKIIESKKPKHNPIEITHNIAIKFD
jgi:LPS O-antigen subunit length determinant protein (WzzB/FepE family)